MRVHLGDDGTHRLELREHVFGRIGLAAHEARHLADHGSDAPAQCAELAEGLLKHRGEGEEAEGVPCWCRIEHDDRVLHGLYVSSQRTAQHEGVTWRWREPRTS